MKTKLTLVKGAALLLLLSTLIYQPSIAHAQGTAFTYQGRLNDGVSPANGNYDLKFSLFAVNSGGSAIAGPLTNSPTAITNGLFTVILDFGANFPGASRWLEIAVRTNGGGVFTNLAPRQQITATPYAITASNLTGSLPASQLSGTLPVAQLPSAVVTNNQGGVSFTGTFTGNGSGLTNVNATTLGGLNSSNFWKTGGNAGTTPGPNFVGTSDNQALEIRVNGARGLRIEPDLNFNTPNVIGGSSANFVRAGSVGNFIGAGGQAGFASNSITGGNLNVIAGGWDNHITNGLMSSIGGGESQTIGQGFGTIGGGNNNSVIGQYGTVPGGANNLASGNYSFAAGQNAQAQHDGSFVWADNSTPTPFASTAANQFLIRAGFVGINRATQVSGNEYFGIYAPVSNTWVGMYIQGQAGSRPFYGYANPSGNAWTEVDGTDVSKWKLYNYGYRMTVTTNGSVGIGTTDPQDAILDIEGDTHINDHDIFLRAGTDRNHGLGYRASVIAGSVTNASVDGPFLSGYNGGALGFSGPDTAILTWSYFGTVTIYSNLVVTGSASKPGGGSWSVASDARLKKNIQTLAGALNRLLALRAVTYEYKDPQAIHELPGVQIGMVAQEVEKVFPEWVETGNDGMKRLSIHGFEALTVEALRELREEKEKEVTALKTEKDAEIQQLKQRLEKLEQLMNQKNGGAQ